MSEKSEKKERSAALTPEEKEARRLKRKESSRGDFKDDKKKSRSSKSSSSKSKSKLPPIPPESELNTRFERLLVKFNFKFSKKLNLNFFNNNLKMNMGFKEEQKAQMKKLDKTAKWELICQNRVKEEQADQNNPDAIKKLLQGPPGSFTVKNASALRISVCQEDMAWVQSFIDIGAADLYFAKFKELVDSPALVIFSNYFISKIRKNTK